MNVKERQTDIINVIKKLDISPTMYNNAVSKYHSIADYLESHGFEADIYPQGSFALGTVIRPTSKNTNAAYDLDFIYQMSYKKEDLSAKETRNKLEEILTDSDLYGGKLTVYDECFTIEYADVNDIGFSIDIVPAVNESTQNKEILKSHGEHPELIETAIAIPKKKKNAYDWLTNNPKGYKQWFDKINEPFKNSNRLERRRILFEETKTLYCSVEEIPDELERSSLQRVIQILKYHRNVYYNKRLNGEEIKPISAIITTIVTRIANTTHADVNVFELLQYVLTEISTYSEYQCLTEKTFLERYGLRDIISKKNGKWIIINPANPFDNLADAWNNDDRIAPEFFKWARTVKKDLLDSLNKNDEGFRATVEGAFGLSAVKSAWGKKYYIQSPKVITHSCQAKPWKNI